MKLSQIKEGGQIGRQTDGQWGTNRQTDKQTHRHKGKSNKTGFRPVPWTSLCSDIKTNFLWKHFFVVIDVMV